MRHTGLWTRSRSTTAAGRKFIFWHVNAIHRSLGCGERSCLILHPICPCFPPSWRLSGLDRIDIFAGNGLKESSLQTHLFERKNDGSVNRCLQKSAHHDRTYGGLSGRIYTYHATRPINTDPTSPLSLYRSNILTVGAQDIDLNHSPHPPIS